MGFSSHMEGGCGGWRGCTHPRAGEVKHGNVDACQQPGDYIWEVGWHMELVGFEKPESEPYKMNSVILIPLHPYIY